MITNTKSYRSYKMASSATIIPASTPVLATTWNWMQPFFLTSHHFAAWHFSTTNQLCQLLILHLVFRRTGREGKKVRNEWGEVFFFLMHHSMNVCIWKINVYIPGKGKKPDHRDRAESLRKLSKGGSCLNLNYSPSLDQCHWTTCS